MIDKNAPLKEVSRKQKKLHKKPWLSHDLLKAIKDKRKMYKTHFLNGNSAQKELYKRFSNKLTKMKTRAKRNYFESELQNHCGNLKKTWEILKSLLPNKSFQIVQIGQACNPADSLHKANQFNEFFCSIRKELAKKASSNHPIKYSTYLRNSVSYTMYLEPPTTNEIINCIGSLNVNKADGHDSFPAYFLKIAAPTLAPYL